MLFRIRPGFSFRDHDDTIKGAGETIELDEESAQIHAHKVEPAPAETPPTQTSAPGSGNDET